MTEILKMADATNAVSAESEENTENLKKLSPTILDHFSKLTFEKEKQRIAGGIELVLELSAKNSQDEEELKYAVNRLIRGLAASSTASKSGFLMTLTVLLKHSQFDVNIVNECVEKELQTSRNYNKGENANILTGQILLFCALLRSGKLGECNEDTCRQLFQMMLDASKKKSYLGLLGMCVFVENLEKLELETFKIIKPIIIKELSKPLKDYSLDNLYLFLKLLEKYPKVFGGKFLEKNFQTEKFFSKKTVSDICDVLLNILPLNKMEQHPVFELVGQKVAESSGNFIKKFLETMDAKFVKPSQIKHQVLCIIYANLLEKLYENVNKKDFSILPQFLGTNFIQETLRHYKNVRGKTCDDVQVRIIKFFDAFVNVVKDNDVDDEIKLQIVEKLTIDPGIFIFEKLTRTKYVQRVVSTLSFQGVQSLVQLYSEIFHNKHQKVKQSGESSWLITDRLYAMQLLIKLLDHQSVKDQAECVAFRSDHLINLMHYALFESELDLELVIKLKDTFFNALNVKFSKLHDLRLFLSSLMHKLYEKVFVSMETLRKPLKEDAGELLMKVKKIVDKLEAQNLMQLAKNEEKQKIKGKIEEKLNEQHLTPVFHTLFTHMFLLMFSDSQLATESLKDLIACYKKRKQNGEKGDLPWIEVVVDLFMNLLSHDSHLLRTIIASVFPHLCPHLTVEALAHLLSVLDNQKNVLLDDSSDSDDSDEETALMEEEHDLKKQRNEIKENIEAKEEEESEESSEEEAQSDDSAFESEEPSEEAMKQSEELKMQMQNALRLNSNWSHVEEDAVSVDLDQMSETEGHKLDMALSQVLTQFQLKPATGGRKKKQPRSEQALMHFRIRILDLVDIYLNRDVSARNCLEIMLPLLKTLEFSIRDQHNKPLLDRVRTSMKKLTTIKQFKDTNDVDEKVLVDLLHSLLQKGTKSALLYQEMSDKLVECCLFVERCAQQATNVDGNALSEIFVDSLDVFLKERNCLTPLNIFRRLLDSSWTQSSPLLRKLFETVFDSNVRVFRRCQALELMHYFYTNKRILLSHGQQFKKTVSKRERVFLEQTVAFFDAPNYEVREKFLSALFLLLGSIKNSPVQQEAFDWGKLGQSVCKYRAGLALGKDTRSAFAKLCRCLQIPANVPLLNKEQLMKLKGPQMDEEMQETREETVSNGKKPHSRGKEAKERKMSKQLRQVFSSAGLGDVAFPNCDLNSLEIHELGQETIGESAKKAKKRKLKGIPEETTNKIDKTIKTNGNKGYQDSEDVSTSPQKKKKKIKVA